MGTLALLLQFALGTLYLTAGASKLASPAPLGRAMRELSPFTLAPRHWDAIARGIAVLEIVLAFGLALTWIFAPVVSLLFGVAVVAFSVRAVFGGYRVNCGCFGHSKGQPMGWRNIMLGVAISLASVLLTATSPTVHDLTELERLLLILLASLSIASGGAARRYVSILLRRQVGDRHAPV